MLCILYSVLLQRFLSENFFKVVTVQHDKQIVSRLCINPSVAKDNFKVTRDQDARITKEDDILNIDHSAFMLCLM